MRRLTVLFVLATLFGSLDSAMAQGRMGGGAASPEVQQLLEDQKAQATEYLAAQKAETETFMKSLAGKDRDAVIAAVREFKSAHYAKNCEFRETQFAARKRLVTDLAAKRGAGKMAERKLAQMDANYEKLKTFHVGKNDENMAFLDKLAADPSIKGEALMNQLKAFFQSQKEDAKEFMEGLKAGAKAE